LPPPESAVPCDVRQCSAAAVPGFGGIRRNRWTRVPSRCQQREPGSRSARPRPDHKLDLRILGRQKRRWRADLRPKDEDAAGDGSTAKKDHAPGLRDRQKASRIESR
jgi:hypothetical protein